MDEGRRWTKTINIFAIGRLSESGDLKTLIIVAVCQTFHHNINNWYVEKVDMLTCLKNYP